MKNIILVSLSLLAFTACTSASSPRSVVYETNSFDACADVGGVVSGSKFGNVYKNIFGGSSMMACKSVDVVEDPVVIERTIKKN